MTLADTAYAVRREDDVAAMMRDGTVLRADIYRPQAAGTVPVLVLRTPYNKRRPLETSQLEEMAAHGYIVVAQDIRGRYASDGEHDLHFGPGHGDANILDGCDTVEWAATLPESTGVVGTLGVSYMARTQWQLAPTRPPHLKAMFAGGVNADSRDTWPGIFTRDRQLQWFLCRMVPDSRRRKGLPGPQTPEEAEQSWANLDRGKWLWFEPMDEFPEHVLGGLAHTWQYWLRHQHTDWNRFGDKFPEIDVPVYHETSWYDRTWGTVNMYNGMVNQGRTERARKSQKLLLGPWSHGFEFPHRVGVMDFGPEAALSYPSIAARWFDYWLKGIDNGIMEEPPIRLFVMGENKWRYEYEWPLARTRYLDFYLHSGGGANTPRGDGALSLVPPSAEAPDTYEYDPRDPVMSIHSPNGQAGPGDVRVHDDRQDILVYQTEPLASDTEITGHITIKLFASSTALDTDWNARLVDVHPDGFAVNLSLGVLRARYRESWDSQKLLDPGKIYEYTIRMSPTSNLFKAGHRIRLDITSSDFPNYDRNHNTGLNYWEDSTFVTARQAVFHEPGHPSKMILPVIQRS